LLDKVLAIPGETRLVAMGSLLSLTQGEMALPLAILNVIDLERSTKPKYNEIEPKVRWTYSLLSKMM
jgi:hypothetical protein